MTQLYKFKYCSKYVLYCFKTFNIINSCFIINLHYNEQRKHGKKFCNKQLINYINNFTYTRPTLMVIVKK